MANKVRASHILVDNEEHANQIKIKLDRGESFEDLAKEKSECPSREKGGDLGWFGRGDMVPPFEKAVYSMDEGDISDPVETEFGWHIIKKTGEK